jgi:uncharacterized cupredoxin-like copper-binding protein
MRDIEAERSSQNYFFVFKRCSMDKSNRDVMRIAALAFALSASTVSSTSFTHGESEQAKPVQVAAMPSDEKSFGQPGDTSKVTKTIEIDMFDTMRFTPAKLNVLQGDTVKFVIRNKGKLMHEMVLGARAELDEHAAMMRKHPGMEHDEPYMAHVAPGKQEELVWQFTQPGNFEFACLIPGHFEAGMTGTITVSAR